MLNFMSKIAHHIYQNSIDVGIMQSISGYILKTLIKFHEFCVEQARVVHNIKSW